MDLNKLRLFGAERQELMIRTESYIFWKWVNENICLQRCFCGRRLFGVFMKKRGSWELLEVYVGSSLKLYKIYVKGLMVD